tara:strand:+ start:94 stop:342 length:249 start_codon:yes stop_codon:yes gene_type:complete
MKLLILILLLSFQTSLAHAYIDPGFIAGFFNLIVASVASLAVIFIFRPYYYFKNLFNKIFKKDDYIAKNKENDEVNKDNKSE